MGGKAHGEIASNYVTSAINKWFTNKNPKELKRIDSQARVQAEHYGSRNYAISVLEVYERAIKTKEAEYRFGIFSKVYQRIKEMFK